VKGIAICWPLNSRRIAAIAARGRIPLHCIPHQATLPGSKLALVAPNGKIQLLCVATRRDGPRRVHLASGEYKQAGYELVARNGSIKTSKDLPRSTIGIRWRAIGQMRYFDQRTFRPLNLTGDRASGPFLSNSKQERQRVRFRAFSGGIPGLDHDNPEAKLVRRYVDWVGSPDHFLHAQALEYGGWTDLFNTTQWTLFEAKANCKYRSIREAFGQLHDYRRSFSRSPRLATLLPERPSPRMLGFLSHCGVVAVWERARGGFTDSSDGHLTTALRAEYRERARG
jgi:hypothetical protein